MFKKNNHTGLIFKKEKKHDCTDVDHNQLDYPVTI